MFGKPPQANPLNTPAQLAANDVARIQGGGLVQVIVTSLKPLDFYLFLNDRVVPQIDVESLSVSIEAQNHVVRATLSRYVTTVTGEKSLQRTELFPCTLELVALGRRISITCTNADSLQGLWITLGLRPDGTGGEVTGAKEMRILVTEGIVDARLIWEDGESEDLLPQ